MPKQAHDPRDSERVNGRTIRQVSDGIMVQYLNEALLGSVIIDQSQKMMVTAMQMVDMKVWALRS